MAKCPSCGKEVSFLKGRSVIQKYFTTLETWKWKRQIICNHCNAELQYRAKDILLIIVIAIAVASIIFFVPKLPFIIIPVLAYIVVFIWWRYLVKLEVKIPKAKVKD